MKTTITDIRNLLVNDNNKSDRHFYGVVTRKNTNQAGKVKSYEVSLGGNEGTMTCRKLAGANVGDTVMVTLTKTGMAVVTGTVDGDKDAENALTAATEAQQTVDDLSDTVDGIEDLVGDGDESGIVITTQYYLSTSNTTPTGGSWQDTLPAYVDGSYYWTKTVTTYADGSEVESTPILDVGSQLTAETNAVATATDQHFWSDSTGAYVTKSDKNLSSGYAMKITSNGLMQTYNGNTLMSLSGSGLTFYQSNGSTPMASFGSAGATLYGGGTTNYATMTSDGLEVWKNSSKIASFSEDTIIGKKVPNSNTSYWWEFSSTGGGYLHLYAKGDTESPVISLGSEYFNNYWIYVNGAMQATGKITGGSISTTGALSAGAISGASVRATTNPIVKVVSTTKSSQSIAETSYGNFTVNVPSQTGYTAIGISGISLSGTSSTQMYISQFYTSSSSATIRIRNTGSASSDLSIQVYFLFLYTG